MTILRQLEESDGSRIRVRRAEQDDAAAIHQLYGRLDAQDLRHRFFTAHQPRPEQVREWVERQLATGSVLVVELVEASGSVTLIGEAGFSALADGNAELGLTIDPRHRGWLGAWLLDALVVEAAEKGINALEAEVLTENRKMIGLLRHRGSATMPDDDLSLVRILIPTSGTAPPWPAERTGPRLLGTRIGSHLARHPVLAELGTEQLSCPGPRGSHPRCPVLRGKPCPLVAGADLVLAGLPDDDPRSAEILAGVRRLHPDTLVVTLDELDTGAPPCRTGEALATALASLLVDAPHDTPSADDSPTADDTPSADEALTPEDPNRDRAGR